LRAARLSGTLGIETSELAFGVLELDALCRNSLFQEFDPVRLSAFLLATRHFFSAGFVFGAKYAHLGGIRRFCANLLNLLKPLHGVKLQNLIPSSRPYNPEKSVPGPVEGRTQRKISKSNQQ
jgi:hypothetical protein